MVHEILNAIWTQLQPILKEVIITIVTIIIGYISIPRLINKLLTFIFSHIHYAPVEQMAWGLVRHVATKYPNIPGQQKLKKIFDEIHGHYSWFPSDKLLAIIQTQYRVWQGELALEKKR